MSAASTLPPQLDLDGTIVVLTHPRTGSSLLMQTLRLLGVEVVGEAERADVAAAANPKGFYEHLGVIAHGLYAPMLAQHPALLRGHAVKVGLPTLSRRHSEPEWLALSSPRVVRLLPIRSPSESLRSEKTLFKEGAPRGSADIVFSARMLLRSYGVLTEWFTSPQHASAIPDCIDHRQAIDDPTGYVDRVARCARLQPTGAQRAAAIANIDRDLYRFRSDEPDPAQPPPNSHVQLLERIYQTLRRDAPDNWTRLHALLPRWTREPRQPPAASAASAPPPSPPA